MASSRIKGITIEIGGDTTGLDKALKGTNSEIKSTQSQLKDVEKLLKLDPKNTELLKQKMTLLKKEVSETKEKLETLKQAQAQMDQNGVDKNSEQYMALQREIIATENELKNLQTDANSAVQALDKISDTANKVADATKGISTAAGAALGSLVAAGYSAVTSADDLNTLAKQTGFTTAELQKMQYASDLVDVSMDDITSSATKLKKNMTSTSDSVTDAFKQLGVSVTDANGNMRDSTEVFWEVITALSNVGNETERDQLAMTLLGRGADSLAGIIDDGAASFNELGDEAERAGLIMSQDTLDSLNDVNDEIDKIKATAKATLAETGAKAIEALLPVINQIITALTNVLTFIGSLNTSQITMLITVLALVAAISPIASLIANISIAAKALIPIITAINAAIAANPIILLIAAITIAIAALTIYIIKNWDEIKLGWQITCDEISANFETLKENIITAFNTVKNTVSTVFNGIKIVVRAIINSLISMVESGINAVINKINAVISAFNSVVSAVARAVGLTYSGISQIRSVKLPKLATGGVVHSGTALVGEAGPELLTVANGNATVTPLTATVDSKSLSSALGKQSIATNVNVTFTGSLAQLAAVLQPAVTAETARRGTSLIKA